MSLLTRLLFESVRSTTNHYRVKPSALDEPPVNLGGRKNFDPTNKKDRNGAIALSAAYIAATGTRQAYLRKYQGFRNHYLVDAILSSIYDDAFTPDATSGEVVSVTSSNPNIKAELDKLQKTLNLDLLVASIVEDLLGEGEVSLRTVIKPGKGIVDVCDDVDNTTIVALYDGGMPRQFLEITPKGLVSREAWSYVHFCLGSRKIKIGILAEAQQFGSGSFSREDLPKGIPSYVRIGKPLFYGTLSKISELQLLESLIPSSKIAELTRGSVLGLSVPATTQVKEAFDMCRKYENLFNSTIGVNRTLDELTTADILGVAGRTKVVPIYGDKGQISSVTESTKNSTISDILQSVTDMRSIICTSVGFPSELLFGGETKSETLKKYARYLRKLKAVQYAVAQGLKQLCVIHLINLSTDTSTSPYKSVSYEDISVKFRNELISIDELEKLEFSDALTSTVQDLFEFFNNIKGAEGFHDIVDVENVKKWLRDKMSLLRTEYDIIRPSSDGQKKETDRKPNVRLI